MYLYLGQETVIRTGEIIGIFDLETSSVSRITKSYLSETQKKGHIVAVSAELPKSFVVCENQGAHKVYLSQISPATLKKRALYLKDLGNF